MKALLASGDAVDLGPDTAKGIARAGRLYKKGVFNKIIIERPVPCCGWRNGHPIGGYWAFVDAGLIRRQRVPGFDEMDVVYTITANVEFTDENGENWKQGDEDIWQK